MRLTLSKSRDHLNAENIPKKLSRSHEKFCKIRSLSKSQEVLSASLTHAKRRVGAVSDMNHAQHMVTAIMNDTDNTLDLVLVPGGHALMSHPDLLRTNSGSLQMLPITESGRSTPGSLCSISTVHDIQCANYGMYLNPSDGCMGTLGGSTGQSASNIPINPPSVVIATPTASEPPQIEPINEVSEEEELETKSNASNGHEDENIEFHSKTTNTYISSEIEGKSILKKVQNLTANNKETTKGSNTLCNDIPSSKEEKESINYEKKQNMSRSASVDADIGRAGVTTKNTKSTKHNKKSSSETTGSSNSINLKETASIGIQVNLMKSTSSPNLVRKPNSNEKVYEAMEIDIEEQNNHKSHPVKAKKEPKISSTGKRVSNASRRSSSASSNSKKESIGAFSHDSMLGDGDIGDKPNYAWREELAKFQSQKPLRVSKLIGTFDKSGNCENAYQEVHKSHSANDLEALKRKRRGSLQIQLNENILKDLASAGEEARKKEAKEKEQRRKSTSSILMRNIENMKIQDKITDILDHGHKGVIEEKALEKTDVSEKLDDGSKLEDNNLQEVTIPLKADDCKSKRNGNNNNLTKTNLTERLSSQDKQKLNYNKDKQKLVNHETTNLPKRTSSPYLDRKQQQAEKSEQKQKNWDYFEISHPKAISDKKLQELKAKYQRRRTEGTLLLERDKKVATGIREETSSGNADTKAALNSTGSNNTRTKFGLNSSPASVRPATGKDPKAIKLHQEPCRSNSVPVMETPLGQNKLKEKSINLELSIDPLTGECLASRTETAMLANIKEDSGLTNETNNNTNEKLEEIKGSYTENLLSPSNCRNSTGNIHIRKISSDEELCNSSSRRSSRSSRRKSSHLADIQEQYIPDEKILEVRIDPLTGQVETVEVLRSKSSPTPNSPSSSGFFDRSKPLMPAQRKESEKVSEIQDFDSEKRRKLSVEVTKVTCSTKTTGDQHDDGIGSLPVTPIDKFLEHPPRLSVPPVVDESMTFSNLDDDNFDKLGHCQREQRETSTGNSSGGSGITQFHTVSLDGGYGADSVCSWDESSSVAPDDDGEDIQSRPASAQPSVSTSTLTVAAATSSGNLSSTSTSSSTSALCNNGNVTNQVNRTCSGAVSRAMERLNANQPLSITAQSSTNSDSTVNNSMEDKESDDDERSGSSDTYNDSVMRRQSSPMVRPSSS